MSADGVSPSELLGVRVTALLVTGANGFVGGAFVRRLGVEHDLNVRAIVRKPGSADARNVEYLPLGDLDAHTDWRRALSGISVVVHVAARAHVMNETVADPDAAYRQANTDVTLSLARQAAAGGVRRFVFVSSVKVHGETSEPGRPLREQDPRSPVDPYGRSKLEAELGLREIEAATGMSVVCVRPPLVYGPGVRANFARLVDAVRKGWPLPLGALRNARSLVGLDNLVDFLRVCAVHPQAAGQDFFVSDGEDLSTPELLRRVARALGRQPVLLPVPVPVLRLAGALTGRSAAVERLCGSLQVSIDNARHRLGWHPPVSVDAQLRRMLDAP